MTHIKLVTMPNEFLLPDVSWIYLCSSFMHTAILLQALINLDFVIVL